MQEELQLEQQIQEQPQDQELEQSPEANDAAVEQEKNNSRERNFASLRNAKELAEKERDAYYKKLQEIEQSQKAARIELGDDDLAEGRHVKELKKELESYKLEMQQVAIETRLKNNFPDFDSVVNKDTIAQLRTAYPEIAATLSASNDLYNTAASAYTMIKKLGIYDNAADYNSNRSSLLKNSLKPRPLTSVSPQQADSPLSQANAFANGLTKELKQKLYQEMIEARKAV
jgi:hypothetical protein